MRNWRLLCRRGWTAAVTVFVLTFGDRAQGEPNVLGARVSEYQDGSAIPLRMPTAVAVRADGSVIVADGVNDRVVVFDDAGQVKERIESVGDQHLSRPMYVAGDKQGRLWIADTGNGRVLVRDVQGRLVRAITPPTEARRVEITSVAPTEDGAWLVDNHNHRLLRYEWEEERFSPVGGPGEALGQLNHPFFTAVALDDAVVVTDVINGRIARFSGLRQDASVISAYGVHPGQLYRPKGIAVDSAGLIWVSDSVLGVVQVFTASGQFLDVLRDSKSEVTHFNTPMGLAFDGERNLYVVELGANRVQRLGITVRSAVPSPDAKVHPQITGAQARSCTVCHLEWMEPLASRSSTELVRPPDNPPDHPNVSRAETCLSCHDGSVIDSRRKVWLEHSHRTGVKPKPEMTVPPNLPLVDGRIDCRTCHSAHSNGQFQGDAATAVFLRATNAAGELCIGCHADKTRGPKLGTHPTGGMPWPVPKQLIEAGAKTGLNPRELTCTVCHSPHGSKNDHLLVMGTGSNQLCLTCHEAMRPGLFRDGPHKEHPLSPVVNDEQRRNIERMGTKLGDEGRLVCLSCHKLHHGKGERFMLAEELTEGRFCISCHSEKTSVFGTNHDLRRNFPEEKNRLGMTPSTGGPCSACHMFHRYARAPEISEVDPNGGKCITCHQSGRCAGTKSLPEVNHLKTPCVSCHDPHKTELGHYLRAPTSELCVKCHSAYAALEGGPHDAKRSPGTTVSAVWPAASVQAKDQCMACHRPHGDATTGLFRVAPATGVAPADGACLTCHPKAAPGAAGAMSLRHPLSADGVRSASDGSAGATSAHSAHCFSCHNPHRANGRQEKFLREGGAEKFCTSCHSEVSPISMTKHTAEKLGRAGLASGNCLPCHDVHAPADAVREKLMWPKSLASPVKGETTVAAASVQCVACHRAEGPAPAPKIATHPPVGMFNPQNAEDVGSLPLYNAEGCVDANGVLSCKTCHLPHGHWPDQGMGEAAQARASRLMLRPFISPNVCTTCHGADARRRFLYFHDPNRRGGPLAVIGNGTR